MKNLIIPEGSIICPECEGKKYLVYSCCTGEIVDNDFMMCPRCKEHLGEEDCTTCEGKGWVMEEIEIKKTI